MSPSVDTHFPRAVLLGATALIAVSMLLALGTRQSGIGVTRLANAAVVANRALRFEDRADGAVVVWDAQRGAVIEVLPPGTNGFVRGVMRGLARDRKLLGVGHDEPFALVRWADGRMSLEDPTTGRTIALEPFGADNSKVFARFLSASTDGTPTNALVATATH